MTTQATSTVAITHHSPNQYSGSSHGQVPPAGFTIVQTPEPYRIEENYLNMKGKRLEPLKTEDLKIIIQPLKTGIFTLNPRILYLDERGTYKSHHTEPKTITVKELGIKGWIKGEK